MFRFSSWPRLLLASAAMGAMALAGCSTGSGGQGPSPSSSSAKAASTMGSASHSPSGPGMGGMHGGPVPAGMKTEAQPKYTVGSKVILTADHMAGMKGAHATIVSSTTQPVYVIDYTANGHTMKNHKWVVQDELKPASSS